MQDVTRRGAGHWGGFGKGTLVAAALAMVFVMPTAPARADNGGAIVGGILGGLIAGAISAEASRGTTRRTTTHRAAAKPSISSAQREANREVQQALNTFGFPVGTPDGALGPKSRAAIGQYQVFMGYPGTGQLTDLERMILVGAWQKSVIGGAAVATVVATDPQGIRGLLTAERDMMAGGAAPRIPGGSLAGLPPEITTDVIEIAQNSGIQPEQLVQKAGFVQLADMNADGRTDYLLDTSATGSAFWCGPQSCTVRVFVSTPQGFRRNDFQAFNATPAMFSCVAGSCIKLEEPTMVAAQPAQPPATDGNGTVLAAAATVAVPQPAPEAVAQQPVAQQPQAVAAAPALPSFTMNQPAGMVQSVAAHCANVAMTTSSAGFVTEAAMGDPMQALGEQFCLARGYAINDGQGLAAQVMGATPVQIEAQCLGLVPALSAQLAALSTATPGQAIATAQSFVLGSGQTAAQMAITARICLSVAYRIDNAELAMDAALLLNGAGRPAYGELIGHHLAMGFGMPANTVRAAEWLQVAVGSVRGGSEAAFAPAQPERLGLLEKAALMMTGAAPAATQPVAAEGQGLPSFNLPAQTSAAP